MTVLSDDAVIKLAGFTGEAATITVAELKTQLLSTTNPLVSKYQAATAETLEPSGVWTAGTLAITITVDDGN